MKLHILHTIAATGLLAAAAAATAQQPSPAAPNRPAAPSAPASPSGPAVPEGPRAPAAPSTPGQWQWTTDGSLELSRTVPRGRIGVTLGTIDDVLATHLNLDAEAVVLITSVIAGAPAEQAGIRAHDIITHIDGSAPATAERLRDSVAEKEPGDTITLTARRGSEQVEVAVTIEPNEIQQIFVNPTEEAIEVNIQLEAEELAQTIKELLAAEGDPDKQREVEELLRRRLHIRRPPSRGTAWRFTAPDDSTFRDAWQREVEIRREADGRDIMVLRPSRPAGAPQMTMMPEFRDRQLERMQRIEQRLERIEQMLQQILDASRD